MDGIKKLQHIFEELRKDKEAGHSSAYELQWEDIETIEKLIQQNQKLKNKCRELIKEKQILTAALEEK